MPTLSHWNWKSDLYLSAAVIAILTSAVVLTLLVLSACKKEVQPRQQDSAPTCVEVEQQTTQGKCHVLWCERRTWTYDVGSAVVSGMAVLSCEGKPQ